MNRKKSLRDSYREKIMREGFPTQKPRTGLRKVGKRGKKRQQMNARLNKLGITSCEMKLEGCWRESSLTWAHSTKSRFIQTDEQWLTACRACLSCHRLAESMSHERMERIVLDAIARRPQTVF